MREEIPVIPVVEVRETFTPSEALRNGLENLLNEDMDEAMKESLRAAFLFKSWRRRVLHQDDYYMNEYNHNGTIYKATKDFERLPRQPILFTPRVWFDNPSLKRKNSRIVFTAISPPALVVETQRILDTIPTCEPLPPQLSPVAGERVYVEFATHNLRSQLNPNFLIERLRPMFHSNGPSSKVYVTPKTIITRETIMRLPLDVSNEAGSDGGDEA